MRHRVNPKQDVASASSPTLELLGVQKPNTPGAISERSTTSDGRSMRSLSSPSFKKVFAKTQVKRASAVEASPRDTDDASVSARTDGGEGSLAPAGQRPALNRSATTYYGGIDRPVEQGAKAWSSKIAAPALVRDFVTRSLHHEVQLFPEQVVSFVEANSRRIEQSAGQSLWSS